MTTSTDERVIVQKNLKIPDGVGLYEFAGMIRDALAAAKPTSVDSLWPREIFDDHVIATAWSDDGSASKTLRIPWSWSEGQIVIGDRWMQVEEVTSYVTTFEFTKAEREGIFDGLKI